jgi:hypothetical protein
VTPSDLGLKCVTSASRAPLSRFCSDGLRLRLCCRFTWRESPLGSYLSFGPRARYWTSRSSCIGPRARCLLLMYTTRLRRNSSNPEFSRLNQDLHTIRCLVRVASVTLVSVFAVAAMVVMEAMATKHDNRNVYALRHCPPYQTRSRESGWDAASLSRSVVYFGLMEGRSFRTFVWRPHGFADHRSKFRYSSAAVRFRSRTPQLVSLKVAAHSSASMNSLSP